VVGVLGAQMQRCRASTKHPSDAARPRVGRTPKYEETCHEVTARPARPWRGTRREWVHEQHDHDIADRQSESVHDASEHGPGRDTVGQPVGLLIRLRSQLRRRSLRGGPPLSFAREGGAGGAAVKLGPGGAGSWGRATDIRLSNEDRGL
jgi:hypothetical protein